MFRSRTLFVLGAGASHEVGLPIGETLKDHIADKIDIRFQDPWSLNQESGDRQIMWAFQQIANQTLSQSAQPLVKKSQQLKDALPQAISIDNLLDAFRDDEHMATCGKLGIVKCIQEAESNSKLYFNISNREKLNFRKIQNTWFAEFGKILTEGVPRSSIDNIFSNVSFISFNYDRCIEHYIYNAVQNYYSISEDEAMKVLKTLRVFHPYGQIGTLPWQGSGPQNHTFGGEKINLLEVFKHIKTFNEQVHDHGDISELRKAFQEAQTIVFLGFAFHRQNIELLNPSKECSAKRIFATAYGVSRSDCEVIEEELRMILNQSAFKAKLEIRNDLKCADLFREYWRSLTS